MLEGLFIPLVSPKAFNNSYMFKKGGIVSLMSYLKLKWCNNFLRLVPTDFKQKDLKETPFEEGEF